MIYRTEDCPHCNARGFTVEQQVRRVLPIHAPAADVKAKRVPCPHCHRMTFQQLCHAMTILQKATVLFASAYRTVAPNLRQYIADALRRNPALMDDANFRTVYEMFDGDVGADRASEVCEAIEHMAKHLRVGQ